MARTNAELQLIKTDLTNGHPSTGAYGADDSAAADKFNVVNRTREKSTISGAELYNSVDPTEFAALAAAAQTRVRDIWGLGGAIDVRTGKNARVVLLSVFGAGTTTRANLAALVSDTCSRGAELGLAGFVTPSDVADARRLP